MRYNMTMNTQTHLPPSVVRVAESLARWARGYDNHLKWNEKAKFKADLMNAKQRWHGVSPDAFGSRLRAEGMRGEDIAELVEWLRRAQSGRRLVPQRTYTSFTFGPVDPPNSPPLRVSPDWA
jgi:hypothetical protein